MTGELPDIGSVNALPLHPSRGWASHLGRRARGVCGQYRFLAHEWISIRMRWGALYGGKVTLIEFWTSQRNSTP